MPVTIEAPDPALQSAIRGEAYLARQPRAPNRFGVGGPTRSARRRHALRYHVREERNVFTGHPPPGYSEKTDAWIDRLR